MLQTLYAFLETKRALRPIQVPRELRELTRIVLATDDLRGDSLASHDVSMRAYHFGLTEQLQKES